MTTGATKLEVTVASETALVESMTVELAAAVKFAADVAAAADTTPDDDTAMVDGALAELERTDALEAEDEAIASDVVAAAVLADAVAMFVLVRSCSQGQVIYL